MVGYQRLTNIASRIMQYVMVLARSVPRPTVLSRKVGGGCKLTRRFLLLMRTEPLRNHGPDSQSLKRSRRCEIGPQMNDSSVDDAKRWGERSERLGR